MSSHRWQRPKPLPVGATTSLSLEQQQILAAVPRWKKAWVRPSTLKPGQNPNYKIYTWVLDTDEGESQGTEEEMQAALQEVTAGNVPLPSGSGDPSAPTSLAPSGTATPAAPMHPPQQVSAAALQASANPLAQVQHADPGKPPAGPAPSGEAPSVQEAVKGLGEVPMDAAMDTAEVKREERSLVQEDQA